MVAGSPSTPSRLFVPLEERGTDLILVRKCIFSCPNHRLTTQVKFLRWPPGVGLPLLAPTQELSPHGLGQPSRPPLPCPITRPQPPYPGQPHLPSHANAVPLNPSRERKLCTLTLKLDPYNYLSILVCPVFLYHFFLIAKVTHSPSF